ncbi:T9SS type A sorting domain-containing protein [Winogradskyella echinorum]|uniref:T9SS type A sorting domain-containing protein n=1 Tax=Winogradskyella echinorum TaxID=538189 RepID=A0ABR6Y268_9FLAO|nr:T9SS type A sorting domain-containing protein [Winogradskyella echinorum]MBC3846838.1 T9SS type A sorting domain-containing protein [Winogradskyella echinorum]MBC5751186.1 T9SS type A sorting domain-containing protein [Winogradskyella echinorum]
MKVYINKLLTLLILIFSISSYGQSCINDFEGTNPLLNYVIEGVITNDPAITPHYINCGIDPIGNQGSINITSNTPEPYLSGLGINNISSTFNNSGNALKLNPNPNYVATGNNPPIPQSFRTSVTTTSFQMAQGNILSFRFLQIGHRPNGSGHLNPYFQYRLLNSNNPSIVYDERCFEIADSMCGYSEVNDPNYPNNIVVYTPQWRYTEVDLSQIPSGTTSLLLEFSATDCNLSGFGSKHFSTVYIDEICGVPLGNLNIDNINIECPANSFDVCGNFNLPIGTSLTSMSLDILNSSNNIIGTLSNPVINGSNYCFTVNPADFGNSPTGNYSFQVTLNNETECDILSPIIEQGGIVTFNDCIAPCDTITDTTVVGNILSWASSATTFELEFEADGACCPNGGEEYNPPVNLTYQMSNSNQINLTDVFQDIQNVNSGVKCFRYRIKTDCSDWSDWCCLRPKTGGGFENPYNECFPSNPCDDFETSISITDDVLNGTIVYDEVLNITANNSIESGANATYLASNSITLNPGFYAKDGSEFLARIVECVDIDIVPPPTSGKSISFDDKLRVYPNPAQDKLYIYIKEQKLKSFTIYDLYGKVINESYELNDNNLEIDVNKLSRGIYLLQIKLEDNSIITKRIILK